MSAPPEVPRGARARPTKQGYTFWIIGEERATLRDAYHRFLHMRWSASLAMIVAAMFASNLVFAALYFMSGGLAGVREGSFFDALSFSVQTLATIGYGVMYPKTSTAATIMICEALYSVIFSALATGLVFAKFARTTGRIAFSKYAVVTQHEGKPTLIFRCGNRRSNTIVEAQLRVIGAFSTITAEGRPFYKMSDLPLVRDRMAGMRRGWQVMHVIDEHSPLHGMDAAGLAKGEFEMEISLTGLDDVTMQTVHTIHSYSDQDIKFGHRFVDTITALPNGDLILDLTKFDAIVPDAC
jgi:inward rectifier potassium channel